MRIERWEPGDEAAVGACHEVWRAAKETDDPFGSPKSAHVLGAWLKRGFQGHLGEVWLARDASGAAVVAWYRLSLPNRENRESAGLYLIVHPDHRRHGIGTELLDHATKRAQAHGRTRLTGEVRENGTGEAFAARHQATRGVAEVRRMLDVAAIPDGHLGRLRDEAVSKAAGYTLVTWAGPTPEKYTEPIGAAYEAMNDAPHNPGFEASRWDAQRVREGDAHNEAFGFRWYSVIAVHDATGQVAALTQVFVDPEEPDWAHQGLTAVPRAHRGHRLGLLVKTAMLQWLAETEPRVRRIDTGNADSNKHMIAINEALGFRVRGPGWVSYVKPFPPNGSPRLSSTPRPLQWEPADTATASALYGVYRAAHLTDEPAEPPDSPGTHRSLLTGDWEGAPGEVWYLPGESGGAVAYYRLDLPDLENLDRAFVYLFTHPALRRQGAGRALLRHAAERAAAHGRMVLDGVTLEDSAGDAFARSAGATLALEEARRVQELREIPPERIAELRAEAERKAAGYSLVTWTGPVPDEYAAGLAEVVNAFADAPHPEGVQPEVWDADRIRQRTGMLLRAGHLRGYSVAAVLPRPTDPDRPPGLPRPTDPDRPPVREATGEMAAITEVAIDPEVPEWGYQQLTAVTRPHRGHRLGLLVKAAMMQWLADAEPRLERISTGNGVDNEHMIAVNEALGYRLTRPGYRFYEIPVSDVK